MLPRVIGELAVEKLPDAGPAPDAKIAALCGDSGAQLDVLYLVYSPVLRRIAIRKFGIPDSDADDLVQDVFASYLVNRTKVRDLHPYLIGAICQASRQYWRRDAASPLGSRLSDKQLSDAIADDELLESVIRNLIARKTLARLGTSCRDTLERFYLLGESTGSIAEQRQTTSNYICRLLNYCRNRARAIYAAMAMGS